MTTKNDHAFTQFDDLLNSSMPDEYKDLLKKFKRQGDFYQQFVHSNNEQEADLSTFWNLPNTLGFDSFVKQQPEWLQTPFNQNHSSEFSAESLAKQFPHLLLQLTNQAQEHIQSIQVSLTKLNTLYNELSQSAMLCFKDLADATSNPSTEQLCAHWLEAGESTYREFSQTDEYIETHKALIESLSALKNTHLSLYEQASELFGLPSKQSIQELKKNAHKLRMEFAEYKEQTDSKLNALAETIRKLK